MKTYSRSHVTDPALLSTAAARLALVRDTDADFLADIGEIDARKLYVPAGYPSMHAWCVGELRLSADSALKRIQAARTARRFPAIFPALADGRLHLSAVRLLAPHLTEGNAEDLLAAAMDKTKGEIEWLLAQWFPRSEMLAMVEPVPGGQHAPGHVDVHRDGVAPGQVDEHAPGHVERKPAKACPSAPERYTIRMTFGQSTHDKLRYAQELLSHQVPSGDPAEVFDRSLDALIHRLEKQKFAATSRPRPAAHGSANPRHIPAPVKRAVWERDGGQCTFVSEAGHRCTARKLLEYDHIDPVARGGQATVERIRLRCRAHNQYEAEHVFGAGFMDHKRRAAAEARAANRARAQAPARAGIEAGTTASAEEGIAAVRACEQDVIPWLRQLGFRADEARRAAAHCESIPDAPLEQRVRAALSFLQPRCRAARLGVAV